MKRTTEIRPKRRVACDLKDCRLPLDPKGTYPVLSEGGRMFSGVRVFCTEDHRDEYESRIVLVRTWARGEPRVPGVEYAHHEKKESDTTKELE